MVATVLKSTEDVIATIRAVAENPDLADIFVEKVANEGFVPRCSNCGHPRHEHRPFWVGWSKETKVVVRAVALTSLLMASLVAFALLVLYGAMHVIYGV